MTFVVATTSCLAHFRLRGRKWAGCVGFFFIADVDIDGVVEPIDMHEQRWTGMDGRLALIVSCEWRMSCVLLLITNTVDNDVMGCRVFLAIALRCIRDYVTRLWLRMLDIGRTSSIQ